MTDPIQDRLAALLADPARAPDRRFVARVEAAVRAERALAAHRRRTWRRFGVELAAGTATVAAAVLMARQPALAALPLDPRWLLAALFAAGPLAWVGTNRWRVTTS